MKRFLKEFLLFILKQIYACIFGGILLFFILATHYIYPFAEIISRYDFLFFVALITQIILLATKLEEWKEFRVILLYHFVGTVMEVFKLQMGSWDYPDTGFFEIMGVPLFSGFMYAAIGSYIARSWRMFSFEYENLPSLKILTLLSVLIYTNFFTHHFIYDIRTLLFLWIAYLFRKSWHIFTVHKIPRKVPTLITAFGLSIFIWIAENIGTFANAWVYPSQNSHWHMVSFDKLGSWFLLMIISFVMVAWVYLPKDKK